MYPTLFVSCSFRSDGCRVHTRLMATAILFIHLFPRPITANSQAKPFRRRECWKKRPCTRLTRDFDSRVDGQPSSSFILLVDRRYTRNQCIVPAGRDQQSFHAVSFFFKDVCLGGRLMEGRTSCHRPSSRHQHKFLKPPSQPRF